MSGPFDFTSSFGQLESALYDEAFGADFYDPTAQALYHEAYFNRGVWEPEELSAIRESLNSYLIDNYGIDFDAVFDWDAWREAYGQQ